MTPLSSHPGTGTSNPAAATAERRRLAPLHAASATAIIVACLVALAMMTGLLPASWHASALPPTAGPPTALPAPPVLTAHAAQAPSPALIQPLPHLEPEAVVTPARPGQTSTPLPLPAKVSDAQLAVTEATTLAAPAAPVPALAQPRAESVRRRYGNPPRRARHRGQAPAHAHAGAPGQKTREQVKEELLRAKRDGSYDAANELYR